VGAEPLEERARLATEAARLDLLRGEDRGVVRQVLRRALGRLRREPAITGERGQRRGPARIARQEGLARRAREVARALALLGRPRVPVAIFVAGHVSRTRRTKRARSSPGRSR
jgi:hypothetical protein